MNRGIKLIAAMQPLILRVDDCGCALKEDITVISAAGGETLPIVEVIDTGVIANGTAN